MDTNDLKLLMPIYCEYEKTHIDLVGIILHVAHADCLKTKFFYRQMKLWYMLSYLALSKFQHRRQLRSRLGYRHEEKRCEAHLLRRRNQRLNVVNGLISHRKS